MSDSPVTLGNGLPQTVLAPEPSAALEALAMALDAQPAGRHQAVSQVVSQWPRFLDGWARLGDLGRDTMESYAAYRVGYHRGLDALRQSGWRGSGFVLWERHENRGFLRALAGLAKMADRIGEADEAQRCRIFLTQLDPNWSEAWLDDQGDP